MVFKKIKNYFYPSNFLLNKKLSVTIRVTKHTPLDASSFAVMFATNSLLISFKSKTAYASNPLL